MDEHSRVLFITSLIELQANLLNNLSLAQDNYQVPFRLKATKALYCKHSFLKSLHPPQRVSLVSSLPLHSWILDV